MASWMRWVAVALAVGGAGETRCAETPATPSPPARVPIRAIAQRPAEWVGKEALLTGTLANQGVNYFTDLRVVLKDDEGHALAVKPWLPTALPPAPGAGPRPKTLTQYLGKRVELQATVRHGALRAVGETYYLEVKEARAVD